MGNPYCHRRGSPYGAGVGTHMAGELGPSALAGNSLLGQSKISKFSKFLLRKPYLLKQNFKIFKNFAWKTYFLKQNFKNFEIKSKNNFAQISKF